MRTSNNKCRELVQNQVTFQANNLYAVKENGFYVVYSYGSHFPLWVCDGNVWIENVDKYSVSTSKHKSQSNPLVSTWKCNTTQLKCIINGGKIV